ncbi:MAG: hypothetical protein ACYSYL_16785, partial [Planctomycetota bacterium]
MERHSYPDVRKKSAKVRVTVGSAAGRDVTGTLTITANSWNAERKHSVAPRSVKFTTSEPETTVEIDYSMGNNVLLWDEFSPSVYKLKVSLSADSRLSGDTKVVTFGMRQ